MSAAELGPKASTGIVGLDDVLAGGFPREQMCLVEGDPGAGKTTLALQFLMEGVRRGESAVYVILGETEREVRRLAKSHGWSLEGLTILEGIARTKKRESEYSLYHPAEVELDEAAQSIITQLTKLKPQRVVFDSLSELRLLAQDPLRYRRQINTLKSFFQDTGATALLLDFLSSPDDRQLETICHGLVHLEQLAPTYGGQRRRLRVKKLRESEFRDGYHDFTITKGGLQVFPRLVAAEHHRWRFESRVGSTGLDALDAMLYGGIDYGTSTLLLGPAGAGKSTLAAQYVKAAVERGEKAALFIFDEVPNTFVVRSEGLGMGLVKHLESGNITISQIDPAALSPGEFASQVRDAVDKQKASVVVIDSINGYQAAMPEEHFLSAHLHELLAYLNQMGVVTLLVMTQQGLLGSAVTSPIELSYLADTVILLRYFEAYGSVRQAISVVKKRTGRHERTIRELVMNEDGVHLGQVLNEFQGILTGQMTYLGDAKALSRRDDT